MRVGGDLPRGGFAERSRFSLIGNTHVQRLLQRPAEGPTLRTD